MKEQREEKCRHRIAPNWLQHGFIWQRQERKDNNVWEWSFRNLLWTLLIHFHWVDKRVLLFSTRRMVDWGPSRGSQPHKGCRKWEGLDKMWFSQYLPAVAQSYTPLLLAPPGSHYVSHRWIIPQRNLHNVSFLIIPQLPFLSKFTHSLSYSIKLLLSAWLRAGIVVMSLNLIQQSLIKRQVALPPDLTNSG